MEYGVSDTRLVRGVAEAGGVGGTDPDRSEAERRD